MNAKPTWKIANKGLLIILGIFLIATVGAIGYLSLTLTQLDSRITNYARSSRAIRVMQTLQINLLDAESSGRGYIITGDPTYLASYKKAAAAIPNDIKNINAATGFASNKKDISQIASESKEQMVLLTSAVDAKSAGNDEVARNGIETTRSKALTDSLRMKIASVNTETLNQGLPNYRQSHVRVQISLGVATALEVFVLIICGMLIWYFRRSILRERALESTKSEFLSLASHQLRTPATNVKQYIGLLLDGYLGDLTDKQRDALRVAYKNNESEIRIMNDLLDVAKLDLKRIQLRKKRMNIVTVVRQAVKEVQSQAAGRGQELVIKGPDEVMASVDREYLKGVIEKLLDNAVKYSKDKTKISIKVKLDKTLGVFEIIVRDQGLGIHKREVPKLFMKFSRLANEFSATSEGSGMGLYWVKQIMALHGGSVEVVSQEGKGSKFTIRAPLV